MKVEPATSASPPVPLPSIAARPVDYSAESTLVLRKLNSCTLGFDAAESCKNLDYGALISPHAPSFPRLARFFSWLWSLLRSLFSFCLPREDEPAPIAPPSPEILQMAAKVWKKEPPTTPPPAPELPPPILQPAATAVGLYLFRGAIHWTGVHERPGFIGGVVSLGTSSFPLLIANNCRTAVASTFERIAHQAAPTISKLKVKMVSHIAAAGTVWLVANQLGSPLGYFFLINTAFQVFQNTMK